MTQESFVLSDDALRRVNSALNKRKNLGQQCSKSEFYREAVEYYLRTHECPATDLVDISTYIKKKIQELGDELELKLSRIAVGATAILEKKSNRQMYLFEENSFDNPGAS